MQEVVVDVLKHARAGAKVIEGSLETLWVRPTLLRSNRRVCRGDLEDDRCLLERDGGLGCELGCESISPGKVDADFWEPEFEKFELTKVLIEQISGWGASVLVQLCERGRENTPVSSLPAPFTASWRHLCKFTHSVA
jgi:hypothetical protein